MFGAYACTCNHNEMKSYSNSSSWFSRFKTWSGFKQDNSNRKRTMVPPEAEIAAISVEDGVVWCSSQDLDHVHGIPEPISHRKNNEPMEQACPEDLYSQVEASSTCSDTNRDKTSYVWCHSEDVPNDEKLENLIKWGSTQDFDEVVDIPVSPSCNNNYEEPLVHQVEASSTCTSSYTWKKKTNIGTTFEVSKPSTSSYSSPVGFLVPKNNSFIQPTPIFEPESPSTPHDGLNSFSDDLDDVLTAILKDFEAEAASQSSSSPTASTPHNNPDSTPSNNPDSILLNNPNSIPSKNPDEVGDNNAMKSSANVTDSESKNPTSRKRKSNGNSKRGEKKPCTMQLRSSTRQASRK